MYRKLCLSKKKDPRVKEKRRKSTKLKNLKKARLILMVYQQVKNTEKMTFIMRVFSLLKGVCTKMISLLIIPESRTFQR